MENNPPFNIFGAPLNGIHLVEASAGTGKTWNIEAIVVRLLSEVRPLSGKRLKPKDVLVVTFTEAATQELRERIIKRINQVYQALYDSSGAEQSDPFLKDCVRVYGADPAKRLEILNHLEVCKQEFDEASIYTIHGFARTVLKEYPFETGMAFNVDIHQDTKGLVDELIGDFWRGKNIELSKLSNNKLQGAINSWFKKDALTSQFNMFISQPNTQLPLPDAPDRWSEKSIKECYVEISQLFDEIMDIWKSERADIRSELASIKIRSYNYDKDFEKWEVHLLQFIENPFSGVKLTEVERFTPQFFEVKKASSIPQHRIFKKIEDVVTLFVWFGQIEIRRSLIGLRDAYRASREEKKILIFDDLLTILSEALDQTADPIKAAVLKNKLRDRYKVALIDEFQDTDPIQFNIFKKIYIDNVDDADRLLYLIGDPKQAIYKFRGADLNTYLESRSKVDSQFSLAVNYRSSQNMVEGVNRFFQKKYAFINPKLHYQPVSAHQPGNPFITDVEDGDQALRFVQIGNEEITAKPSATNRIIRWVGSHIASIMNSSTKGNSYFQEKDGGKHPISPGDMAILVSTRRQANMIREYLSSIHIPSVETGDTNIFDSRDASLLSMLLECMLNPGASRKLRALLSSEYFMKTVDEIDLWQLDNLRWSDLIQTLNNSRVKADKDGILSGLRYFFDAYEVELTLIKSRYGERRMTNLRHLTELLYAEEKESHRNLSSLINWLKRKRLSESFNDDVNRIRLESDANRVQIVTMHSSKGLEYPIVYAPFLWESIKKPLQHKSCVFTDASGATVMDIDGHMSDLGANLHYMESWEDRIRLAYVTLTRSRYRCYVSIPLHKEGIKSPLFGAQLGENMHEHYLSHVKNSDYPGFSGSEYTQHGILSIILQSEAESNSDVMHYSIAKKESIAYEVATDDTLDCSPREYKTNHRTRLIPERNISSYSSIQRKYDTSVLYDGIQDEVDQMSEPSKSYLDENSKRADQNTDLSIFSFPKGAETGNLWHEIFELIDFGDATDHDAVIRACCEKHGFDDNVYGKTLREMVTSTLQKNLLSTGNLRLSDLRLNQTLREMEFLLKYESADMEKFLKALGFDSNNMGNDTIFGYTDISIEKYAGTENASKVSYLLTGLIDLVFEFEGKYYILDYKSNYLGDHTNMYASDVLKQDIRLNKYNMQYHIYSVALTKYLDKQINNYSHEKHFGGVFYLYLRGINSDNMSGIFFDYPDPVLLSKLIEGEGV
jgi:exodeoxyribonuclease V beta subunit